MINTDIPFLSILFIFKVFFLFWRTFDKMHTTAMILLGFERTFLYRGLFLTTYRRKQELLKF